MSGRCYPEWSKQGPIFVKLTVQMEKRLITNKKISKSEENNKENKKGDIIKGDWEGSIYNSQVLHDKSEPRIWKQTAQTEIVWCHCEKATRRSAGLRSRKVTVTEPHGN